MSLHVCGAFGINVDEPIDSKKNNESDAHPSAFYKS